MDFQHDDDIEFEVCFGVSRPPFDFPGLKAAELQAALPAFTAFDGACDAIWNVYFEPNAWIVEIAEDFADVAAADELLVSREDQEGDFRSCPHAYVTHDESRQSASLSALNADGPCE